MNRFWTRCIKPVVETMAPERILEVGAEFGQNTEPLLEYCRRTGARLDVVDPAPTEALKRILGGYPDEHSFHAQKSLEVIPNLSPAELVLLDGDHNWFTVYNELGLLYLRAATSGKAPPLVLLHDVAWPYARRDLYYDPDGIDIADRNPCAYRGMLPGQSELTDAGISGHFANALHEGGPRNGVLTAVEDFRASCGVKTALHLLPFFNGLGILVPEIRSTAALQAVIDGFYAPEFLLEICTLLENDNMNLRAKLASLQTALSNRKAALARLQEELSELREIPAAPRQSIPEHDALQ